MVDEETIKQNSRKAAFESPILQTKVAYKRKWAIKSQDKKCKRCKGAGYLGDLSTNPEFAVFCRCVILVKVPDDFNYDEHMATL